MTSNIITKLFRVKNGPVLQAKVRHLGDTTSDFSPRCMKRMLSDGTIHYLLYFTQRDSDVEDDWTAAWPFSQAEAILFGDAQYCSSHVTDENLYSDNKDAPGEWCKMHFIPEQSVDARGHKVIKATFRNVIPDKDAIECWLGAYDPESHEAKTLEGVLTRMNNGEDLTVKQVVLASTSREFMEDDLEAAFARCVPVKYDSVVTEPVMTSAPAVDRLPDWAWFPLVKVEHSGVFWHRAPQSELADSDGVFYLTASEIEDLQRAAAKQPEESRYGFIRNKVSELWDVYCKPVLDGEVCNAIRCATFDESGSLVECEDAYSGLYGTVYDYNDRARGLHAMKDYITEHIEWMGEGEYEDVTDRLVEVTDDMPTV